MTERMPLCPQVWPDKYFKAIRNLHGPHLDSKGATFLPEVGRPMPLIEALTTIHGTDAHLTCYALRDAHGNTGSIPLIQKQVLKQIQAEGGNLYLTCIGFDWDTPGHLPLTPPLLCGFLDKFFMACELDERLSNWTAYYTSRHGTRIFYDLKEPVPVEAGEQYIITLLKEFKKHGLLLDKSCRDWTRRFRLPKVMRDGLATQNEAMYNLQIQEKQLDLSQFKKSDIRSLITAPVFSRAGTYPDQEEVHALLYSEGAQGKEVMSFFHKKAKALIRQTKYYDNLFDPNVPFCGDTGRNDFFQAILGTLVPKLINKCEATAEQIFSLFYGPLCELEIFADKQEPAQHCWNFLQDVYEREYSLYLESKAKEVQAIEDGQSALETMAEGMRQWCDADELFSEDNMVVEAFVRGHIFANVNLFFYPMNEKGWYGSLCLRRDQLIPRIRKSFLKDIIATEKTDVKGDLVSMSPIEIANTHATIIHEVRASPLQGVQGRIENMDGDMPILQLPMYQRNDFLPAEFSPAVDGWLRALFGKHFDKAKEWIGWALDFEAGPICALSIKGHPGIGKKMLFEGLAECLVDPCLATGHDMCGKENGALLKTPFLIVNEGLPKAKDMSPADTFKALTAGDPIRVRELYKPPINVINPVRIICAANDHEILYELTRGKEISPDTRKALGERLLHFDLDDGGARYLQNLGGLAFTKKDGHRWIRGDSGQDSDFVVAKHFMYLYKHKKPKNPADRFCVTGNCTEAESFKIASRSEDYALVVRAVIGILENNTRLKNMGCISKTGRAYVTMQGVLAYIREIEEARITEKVLESVLKSIMKTTTPFEKDHLNFYEVDTSALLEYAQPWGIACPRIRVAAKINIGQLE